MSSADQIIEEIRQSRYRLSRECGHDVREYIARLKTFNEKYRKQVDAYRQSHPALPAAAPDGR